MVELVSNSFMKELKQFDKIEFRKSVIQTLLNKNDIPKPMIDLSSRMINLPTNLQGGHVDAPYSQFNPLDNKNDIRELIHKKKYSIYSVINDIGGKLTYIKSGTTGHTFKGVCVDNCDNIIDDTNHANYGVKVVAYPKKDNYGSIHDPTRPENAELLMLKVLSEFVINEQTPHIVLPYMTFNTDIDPFLNLKSLVENKKYDDFLQKNSKKQYHKTVSILLSEWASMGDLLDYIRSNYKSITLKMWRIILFQLLSVLAIIQTKYPNFRHNDLKANNVLLHKIGTKQDNNKFKYNINGVNFIVPNIGIQIKLWDFDFACIPGVVDNAKVNAEWTTKINVNPTKNQYYDLHYFFNTLTTRGFFPDFWNSPYIDDKLKQFVNRVLPEKLREGKRVARRGRLLADIEHTTPFKILTEDPFFRKFRRRSATTNTLVSTPHNSTVLQQ